MTDDPIERELKRKIARAIVALDNEAAYEASQHLTEYRRYYKLTQRE